MFWSHAAFQCRGTARAVSGAMSTARRATIFRMWYFTLNSSKDVVRISFSSTGTSTAWLMWVTALNAFVSQRQRRTLMLFKCLLHSGGNRYSPVELLKKNQTPRAPICTYIDVSENLAFGGKRWYFLISPLAEKNGMLCEVMIFTLSQNIGWKMSSLFTLRVIGLLITACI